MSSLYTYEAVFPTNGARSIVANQTYVGELIEGTIGHIGVSGLCPLGKLYNLGNVLYAGHTCIFLVCSFVIIITFVLQFLNFSLESAKAQLLAALISQTNVEVHWL